MTPRTFSQLHAEFLEIEKRFKAARTVSEQMAILREMEQIVNEMEVIIQKTESL